MAAVNFNGNPISCCKDKMQELTPNTVDASKEKHTPKVKVKDTEVTVKVGETEATHPMTDDHYIYWVCLVTDKGSQRKRLEPSSRPEAVFHIDKDERVINAFAYCNLHGLWVD